MRSYVGKKGTNLEVTTSVLSYLEKVQDGTDRPRGNRDPESNFYRKDGTRRVGWFDFSPRKE